MMSALPNVYLAEIAKLRADNETLRAENWHLKDEVRRLSQPDDADLIAAVQIRLGVTKTTAALLVALMSAREGFATRQQLFERVWGEDSNVGIKLVDVLIGRLRRVLRPHGIEIKTIWGSGLSLSPDNRVALHQLVYGERS